MTDRVTCLSPEGNSYATTHLLPLILCLAWSIAIGVYRQPYKPKLSMGGFGLRNKPSFLNPSGLDDHAVEVCLHIFQIGSERVRHGKRGTTPHLED